VLGHKLIQCEVLQGAPLEVAFVFLANMMRGKVSAKDLKKHLYSIAILVKLENEVDTNTILFYRNFFAPK
jgi:hypothetical protein